MLNVHNLFGETKRRGMQGANLCVLYIRILFGRDVSYHRLRVIEVDHI